MYFNESCEIKRNKAKAVMQVKLCDVINVFTALSFNINDEEINNREHLTQNSTQRKRSRLRDFHVDKCTDLILRSAKMYDVIASSAAAQIYFLRRRRT